MLTKYNNIRSMGCVMYIKNTWGCNSEVLYITLPELLLKLLHPLKRKYSKIDEIYYLGR